MRRLGIVCGVRAEQAALGTLIDDVRLRVRIAGASAARAEDLARELVDEERVDGLLSFGVSGALSDQMKPGDITVARGVIMHDGERIAPARAWGEQLSRDALAAGIVLKHIDMTPADDIIATSAAKRALGRRTGAHAVDMETGGVARIAQLRGVPFTALRAIADGAGDTLPHAALGAVGPGGDIRVLAVVMRLLVSPGDLPAMIRLGASSSAGFKSLRRCARDLLPGLLGIV